MANIEFWGESSDKGKGIRIKGNGVALYNGQFKVEMHGVKMEKVAIVNDRSSKADISDIETDSPIKNTGGSTLMLKRAKIFLKKHDRELGFIAKISFWALIVGTIFAVLTYFKQ